MRNSKQDVQVYVGASAESVAAAAVVQGADHPQATTAIQAA